jgi:hypothetical protein
MTLELGIYSFGNTPRIAGGGYGATAQAIRGERDYDALSNAPSSSACPCFSASAGLAAALGTVRTRVSRGLESRRPPGRRGAHRCRRPRLAVSNEKNEEGLAKAGLSSFGARDSASRALEEHGVSRLHAVHRWATY